MQQASAIVDLDPLIPYGMQWAEPVTFWLLSDDPAVIPPADRLAWRKIGSKLYTFLSRWDNDFVDATGRTVPPALAARSISGSQVTCGRFARQFIRMPFHDCGTFDVGGTGSVGDTGRPRFGCNGSLRWELAPCPAGPQCVNGIEAALDLTTGQFLPQTAFASVEAKYGPGKVLYGQDKNFQRQENTGFANALAFFYQVKLETEIDEPPATHLAQVSMADIIMYAGMLAVAKCGGPHIEFMPGRPDSPGFDAPERLPAPTEPLHHTISYFWTNGVTNLDMINLLTAHSTACFSVGCLDTTPTRYDPDWARQMLSVTTAADPRICNFNPALPPPPPQQMCFLPADVEFNARQDTRNILSALAGQLPLAAAARAEQPCFYQPGVPNIHGACDVGAGVGVDFKPFKLLYTPDGSVNLCSRQTPFADRTFCPFGPGVVPVFQDAVATSYFKMSKWYVNANGVMAGAAWDVARQPCTPGLIQIGTLDGAAPRNPLCLCCPKPPSIFQLGAGGTRVCCTSCGRPCEERPYQEEPCQGCVELTRLRVGPAVWHKLDVGQLQTHSFVLPRLQFWFLVCRVQKGAGKCLGRRRRRRR